MDLLITDPAMRMALIRRRRRLGHDHHDEVWDGVYVMSPLADNEHQELVGNLTFCFYASIATPALGKVLPGVNVTDRASGWRKNYRCPDVVVYLNETKAENKRSHWLGGPDFAVEIVSRYDRSREKLDFYAKVGTRELLLVDRHPWALELYRLGEDGTLSLVGRSTAKQPDVLPSQILPLSFHLEAGDDRPMIAIRHTDGIQFWSA